MRPAVRLIHDLAGRPPVEGASASQFKPVEAVCCMCGQVEAVTAPAGRVLGANFTDRTMFHRADSDRVCEACTAVASGKPPRTFRLWTVVATPGHTLPPSQEKAAAWIGQHDGLCLTSRADTTPIIDTLLDPPDGEWVVSIAESGQKHVAPYAVINQGPTGIIRMETVNIAYQRDTFRRVLKEALALRRLGVPAADIMTGTPRYLKSRADLAAWREYSQNLCGYEGSPLLNLTLWVITKKVIENDTY